MNRKSRAVVLTVLAGGALLVGLAWFRPAQAAVLAALVVAAQAFLVARLLRGGDEEESLSPAALESITSFDTSLRIGEETMPYLRQGLNFESAQKICEIIRQITEMDAVAITDDKVILGFSGVGCRRHQQGGPILTGATRYVLDTGQTRVVNDPRVLSCDEEGCPHPLKAAVITPLKFRGQVVGTFKLYRATQAPLPSYVARLAVGIAALLGIQMELAESERQRQLVVRARLEALQAQIRPHFLFNVLNTIIMFSRTDPERSRELLVNLAQFFRRSLTTRGNTNTLQDELEYIHIYLALEQARFGEKLQVKMKIDPRVTGASVPVLTLQPLVENAIVHGLAPKEDVGVVGIRVRQVGDHLHILIADNGIGMDRERQRRVFEEGFGNNMGLGLTNVNERLVSLYGPEYRLRIRSSPGVGTAIRLRIPLQRAAGQGD
ncbi:two-component system LytT family sensor kinase [Symbiobacterium terraclitae]|uniref:histidine kinase n=1 Tax=Symbiobacterium terraclitae TaxID=557451 RepID=A0ABS4JVQ0_9FIRM|nr:two-component system LytT family sensor kinase [Symbiobacterium terraclitae]